MKLVAMIDAESGLTFNLRYDAHSIVLAGRLEMSGLRRSASAGTDPIAHPSTSFPTECDLRAKSGPPCEMVWEGKDDQDGWTPKIPMLDRWLEVMVSSFVICVIIDLLV